MDFDLIYTTPQMVDLGVINDYSLDLSFGESENNFELTIEALDHCCTEDYFIHIDGTEYGGIVDEIESDTGEEKVIYRGRTWHGIIGSKILVPLQTGETSSAGVTVKQTDTAGESLVNRYLIISGESQNCLAWLISRAGLDGLFEVSTDSEISVNISNWQFYRYADYYSEICRMLKNNGLKLSISFENGKCKLRVMPNDVDEEIDEFNPDRCALRLTRKYNGVNHLVCLGNGDLENRLVLHLYADTSGNISQTQTVFGISEIADTYKIETDSTEEMLQSGVKELQNRIEEKLTYSVNLNEENDFYGVGDIVRASDYVTQTDVFVTVKQKIITIQDGLITISYKVGD